MASIDAISGNGNAAQANVPIENPVDAGINPPQQGQYGANNENLPEDLQGELLNLILLTSSDAMVARRYQVLKCRKARYYWQGLQNIWFDFMSGDYRMPYQGGMMFAEDKDLQEQPRYDYIFNVYQPFGLAFISTFGSQVPTVVWTPRDANDPKDVTAAKSCRYLSKLIEDNNQMQQKMLDSARYLWTDGILAMYSRYVTDKERWGESEYPDSGVEYVKMGEDISICAGCGNTYPVNSLAPQSACGQCGQPLGQDDIMRAPRVAVPSSSQVMKVPNGQVRIDFYGGLEVSTPTWQGDFWDFGWLKLQMEVPEARLKAMWPNAAAKIDSKSAPGAEDLYARIARLAVSQGLPVLMPGDALAFLSTYTQGWIRPWQFQSVMDEQRRAALLKLFPDGAYVAFAGQTYCGSRNEAMSKHWRVMHALPGDGQNRPAVGEASLEVQDEINTIFNMLIEAFEYSMPPVYADPETLDFEALTKRTAEPGVHIPAKGKAGQQLSASFFQPVATEPSPTMAQYFQELIGPMFQLVTGITPAVFGGAMDGVKTAKAYQQARDMSLGRISIPWQRFKATYAEVMQLAVECYKENAMGDAQHVLPGGDSGFQAQIIRLADLDGNVTAFPQADETYPQMRSEKLGQIQQLMSLKDPQIASMLSDPANIGIVKGILGLEELDVPGEDARQHQLREIDMLIAGDPGVAVRRFDNHPVHLGTLQWWFESDAGQQLARDNPQAYAAIEQHALEHMAYMNPAPSPEGAPPVTGEPPAPAPPPSGAPQVSPV